MKKFSDCYPRFTRENVAKYLEEMQVACPMTEVEILDSLAMLQSCHVQIKPLSKKGLKIELDRLRLDAPIMKLGELEWKVYQAKKEVILNLIA